MSRRRILLAAIAFCAIVLLVAVVLVRMRVERRHGLPRFGPAEAAAGAAELPPLEKWTAAFRTLSGGELLEMLEAIETRRPDLYRAWSLAYLHARALADEGEAKEAAARLAPFLAKGHPFRDLALHHRASLSDDAAASRDRRTLIFEHRHSHYREEAIDDEVAWLSSREETAALIELASRLAPSATTVRRRELSSRIIEAQAANGQGAEALPRAIALLEGETSDDAADRAARAIDRPELLSRLQPRQLALLGQTLQTHRHFDRAVAVLKMAIAGQPTDDLQFALGRSWFGSEEYEQAQAAYVRGANGARTPAAKALFLWHAARSAQLRGDDAGAERFMTAAIAVKGTFPATTAALTQRIRTRARQGRMTEAASDLALLKRIAGNRRTYYEGTLPLAVARLARGDARGCVALLDAVPRGVTNPYDRAEIAYWRARALEASDAGAAVRSYLDVLRSPARTQYQTFARERLRAAPLRAAVAQAVAVRDAQVANLLKAGRVTLAKDLLTERVRLSPGPAKLEQLRSVYRRIPEYRDVLDLAPAALPAFPLQSPSPFDLLMAMALYDDATPGIERRWGLRQPGAALTRSRALNLAGASRESIYAVEVMMRSVPDDFERRLLPALVRQLLHPRYFSTRVEAESERHGADPALVLAIMREESRFNPRAKSAAAARGLLQFIITTARDVGSDIGLVDLTAEDLYDPRTIIRLGAKYVGELSEQFDGNGYRVAAAYNAGPNQAALWSRLQPAPGNDYFLAAVNFDETKDYVRKVMNSWEEYESEGAL